MWVTKGSGLWLQDFEGSGFRGFNVKGLGTLQDVQDRTANLMSPCGGSGLVVLQA